jgi:hypothetical protein
MAAIRPDQAKTDAAGAMAGTPGTQVTPGPGRYEIDRAVHRDAAIVQRACRRAYRPE